jgi:hypothetical protein
VTASSGDRTPVWSAVATTYLCVGSGRNGAGCEKAYATLAVPYGLTVIEWVPSTASAGESISVATATAPASSGTYVASGDR